MTSPEHRNAEAGDPKHDEQAREREQHGSAPPLRWLRPIVDRVVDLAPERRREVIENVFPEELDLRSYLYRFSLLQFLAVVIAVFGLIADSPAVVIWTTLVAPLVTPVLALSAAVISGWPKRQAGYLGLVIASAGTVFVAWVLASLLPVVVGNPPP